MQRDPTLATGSAPRIRSRTLSEYVVPSHRDRGLRPSRSQVQSPLAYETRQIPYPDSSVGPAVNGLSDVELRIYRRGWEDAVLAVTGGHEASGRRKYTTIPPLSGGLPDPRHYDRRERGTQNIYTHDPSHAYRPQQTSGPGVWPASTSTLLADNPTSIHIAQHTFAPSQPPSTPGSAGPYHKFHPPPLSQPGLNYPLGGYLHPPSSSSSPGESGGRTERVPSACNPCRERKLKCDGRRPCQQCAKRHIEGQCQYVESVRRRGKARQGGHATSSVELDGGGSGASEGPQAG
ncbi:hypothetical protein IAU60_002175 [Kwoniella sp. DSM 27419]